MNIEQHAVPFFLRENPFFLREMRQFVLRREAAMQWVVVCVSCMIFFSMIPVMDRYYSGPQPPLPDGRPPFGFLPGMIVFVHIILCLAAAIAAADRVFGVERRQSTFEDVLLLPYTPLRWLALKLVFPLCLVAAAWGVGLPAYPLVALVSDVPLADVLALAGRPLGIGLVVLTLILLCQGEPWQRLWHADASSCNGLPSLLHRLLDKLRRAEAPESARSQTQRQTKRRQREDALSRDEVQWLDACYQNPVLSKDLRVHSRSLSMRQSLQNSLMPILVCIAIYWLFVTYAERTRESSWVVGYGAMFLLSMIGKPATLAAQMWQAEKAGVTLTLLCATPLSSREIIQGRLLAAILYGWLAAAPALLLLLAGLVWVALHSYWIVGPLALSLSPLALSWTVCLGGSPLSDFSSPSSAQERGAWVLRILQTGSIGTSCWLALQGSGWPRDVAWLWAMGVFAVNVALVQYWFRQRVLELDAVRRGEMALPRPELSPTSDVS